LFSLQRGSYRKISGKKLGKNFSISERASGWILPRLAADLSRQIKRSGHVRELMQVL
jgi:hypothetical protein